jgi:hypothetical protein
MQPSYNTRSAAGSLYKDISRFFFETFSYTVQNIGKGGIIMAKGVSVIACTNRPHFFGKIISNYSKQLYKAKELIIILNKDSMALSKYHRKVHAYPNVSVYKIREKRTLGHCLN